MPVSAVYATASKVIRRIIVSDSPITPTLAAGESALDIPFELYSISNKEDVYAYIENKIGPPNKSSRCVELNNLGEVVAVYSADPLLDAPIYKNTNILELHPIADVGDIKAANSFIKTSVVKQSAKTSIDLGDPT
jgi:hypothetical protein